MAEEQDAPVRARMKDLSTALHNIQQQTTMLKQLLSEARDARDDTRAALAAERASRRRLAGHVCRLRYRRWQLGEAMEHHASMATEFIQRNQTAVDALAATKEELRLAHSTIRVGMEVIQRLLDDPDGEYERASARAWVREGEEYYARRDQPAASEGGE